MCIWFAKYRWISPACLEPKLQNNCQVPSLMRTREKEQSQTAQKRAGDQAGRKHPVHPSYCGAGIIFAQLRKWEEVQIKWQEEFKWEQERCYVHLCHRYLPFYHEKITRIRLLIGAVSYKPYFSWQTNDSTNSPSVSNRVICGRRDHPTWEDQALHSLALPLASNFHSQMRTQKNTHGLQRPFLTAAGKALDWDGCGKVSCAINMMLFPASAAEMGICHLFLRLVLSTQAPAQ